MALAEAAPIEIELQGKLRTAILAELANPDIDIEDIATRVGVFPWVARGYLAQDTWDLTVSLRLIHALQLPIEVWVYAPTCPGCDDPDTCIHEQSCGRADATYPRLCPTCGGTGSIRQRRGGFGWEESETCTTCDGDGEA
jgi:hypothetical protein